LRHAHCVRISGSFAFAAAALLLSATANAKAVQNDVVVYPCATTDAGCTPATQWEDSGEYKHLIN
jgi:hypothetical protein